MALALILALAAGCSPAPKYYGHPRRAKKRSQYTENQPRVKKPPQERTAPIRFMPPVRRYHQGRISSHFGIREDPRYHTKEFHQGIDIRGTYGEEVLSSASGTVVFAGRQSGFGKVIIIDHGERFCSVYGHLSSLRVTVGEVVAAGHVIGTIGRSGNATGIHLHFEIRRAGIAQDPLHYL